MGMAGSCCRDCEDKYFWLGTGLLNEKSFASGSVDNSRKPQNERYAKWQNERLLLQRIRDLNDSGLDIPFDPVLTCLMVLAFVDQLKLFLRL